MVVGCHWQADDLDLLELLGDVPARIRTDATMDAALAFDHHCSVFKEPRPDSAAGNAGPAIGRTPTPRAAWWCGNRASVSSTRAEPEGPASGPNTLWADP